VWLRCCPLPAVVEGYMLVVSFDAVLRLAVVFDNNGAVWAGRERLKCNATNSW
jgi:hypothetical protein